MTPERFLTCLEADSARIAEVARSGVSAPVPSCPGWTVRDVVDHVAHVYLHKVEAIRNNAPPDPWPPPELSGRDPLELYDEATAALLSELRKRGPFQPTWSWWPEEQTTGFWFRRMAHEAAIHRVDVELAHGAVTPVETDLALDGIDEVLRRFLGEPWWTDNTELPLQTTVRVTSADRSWTITFTGGQVTIAEPSTPTGPAAAGPAAVDGGRGGDAGEVAAEVSGGPEAVLLWLWGRRGDGAVRITGDAHAAAQFRQRLAEATG